MWSFQALTSIRIGTTSSNYFPTPPSAKECELEDVVKDVEKATVLVLVY